MALGILSGSTRVRWYQKGKIRKVKTIWIYWSKRYSVAVAPAGPYTNLNLALERQPCPQLSFLQAGCPSCCQNNSVKALKVM